MTNPTGERPGYTAWSAHHFWWGLLLLPVGFWRIFQGQWWQDSLPFLGIGGILILDDLYQHIRQRWEPTYTSPIHNGYWAALQWAIGHAPEGRLKRFWEWVSRI